jgi:hypothetical protein
MNHPQRSEGTASGLLGKAVGKVKEALGTAAAKPTWSQSSGGCTRQPTSESGR